MCQINKSKNLLPLLCVFVTLFYSLNNYNSNSNSIENTISDIKYPSPKSVLGPSVQLSARSNVNEFRHSNLPKTKVNLIYYHYGKFGNFGDELSKWLVEKLINKDKYELVFNEKKEQYSSSTKQLVALGSMMHTIVRNDTVVWGTGTLYDANNYQNVPVRIKRLDVRAVRGPLRFVFSEAGHPGI